LLDKNKNEIGFGGGAIAQLNEIDMSGLDARLNDSQIWVACDVNNPLTGETGASAVFGPQKGATAEMVKTLDGCLAHFAKIAKDTLGLDIAEHPGAGAAGGMGASLRGFLHAQLLTGVSIVIEHTGLEKMIKDADLVITGEGRIDSQSVFGKAPVGIAEIAKNHGVPVVALAGSFGAGASDVRQHGIDAIFSIVNTPCSLDDAIRDAAYNLRSTASNIAALIQISKQVS
jgi:glycerate kinase